jgi:hypothetical protein
MAANAHLWPLNHTTTCSQAFVVHGSKYGQVNNQIRHLFIDISINFMTQSHLRPPSPKPKPSPNLRRLLLLLANIAIILFLLCWILQNNILLLVVQLLLVVRCRCISILYCPLRRLEPKSWTLLSSGSCYLVKDLKVMTLKSQYSVCYKF